MSHLFAESVFMTSNSLPFWPDRINPVAMSDGCLRRVLALVAAWEAGFGKPGFQETWLAVPREDRHAALMALSCTVPLLEMRYDDGVLEPDLAAVLRDARAAPAPPSGLEGFAELRSLVWAWHWQTLAAAFPGFEQVVLPAIPAPLAPVALEFCRHLVTYGETHRVPVEAAVAAAGDAFAAAGLDLGPVVRAVDALRIEAERILVEGCWEIRRVLSWSPHPTVRGGYISDDGWWAALPGMSPEAPGCYRVGRQVEVVRSQARGGWRFSRLSQSFEPAGIPGMTEAVLRG